MLATSRSAPSDRADHAPGAAVLGVASGATGPRYARGIEGTGALGGRVRGGWNTGGVTLDTILLAISTGAAAVAAWFGWRAGVDARSFFRETARERDLDHLLTITRTLREISETATRIVQAMGGLEPAFVSTVDLLRAQLELVPHIELRKCRAVAGVPRDRSGVHLVEGALVAQALEEVADAIRALRAAEVAAR
jgi:hypothetical protein